MSAPSSERIASIAFAIDCSSLCAGISTTIGALDRTFEFEFVFLRGNKAQKHSAATTKVGTASRCNQNGVKVSHVWITLGTSNLGAPEVPTGEASKRRVGSAARGGAAPARGDKTIQDLNRTSILALSVFHPLENRLSHRHTMRPAHEGLDDEH